MGAAKREGIETETEYAAPKEQRQCRSLKTARCREDGNRMNKLVGATSFEPFDGRSSSSMRAKGSCRDCDCRRQTSQHFEPLQHHAVAFLMGGT
jgi:hypothetical protein